MTEIVGRFSPEVGGRWLGVVSFCLTTKLVQEGVGGCTTGVAATRVATTGRVAATGVAAIDVLARFPVRTDVKTARDCADWIRGS